LKEEPVVSNMPVKKRLESLDHLRGLAIFLMIIVNALAEYNSVPPWLKHAEWNGYTVADSVAPMFVFAMGIAYNLSFSKRISLQGRGKTILHFIKRYSMLYIFGFIGSILVFGEIDFFNNVLQTLGIVGLFSLLFMFMESGGMMLVAFALAIIHQIGMLYGMEPLVMQSDVVHGLYGTLSWSFILLFACALGKWIYDKRGWRLIKVLLFWGGTLTLLGISFSFIFPINRSLTSLSFILFSAGLSTLILLLFYVFTDLLSLHISILDATGKNSLLLFMISSVLILLENAVIPSTASFLQAASGSILVLVICVLVGVVLDFKKIYIKL
jgi:predicted acyltransferase